MIAVLQTQAGWDGFYDSFFVKMKPEIMVWFRPWLQGLNPHFSPSISLILMGYNSSEDRILNVFPREIIWLILWDICLLSY